MVIWKTKEEKRKSWLKDTNHLKVTMRTTTNENIVSKLDMIRFTEEDLKLIKGIQPLVKEHVDDIVGEFYKTILEVQELKKMIEKHSTIERLRNTLREHMIDLFDGCIDQNFLDKRFKVAYVHYKIGLQPEWYMGAFQNLQNSLVNIVFDNVENKEEIREILLVVTKILNFEQQIVLEAYERENVRALERQYEEVKEELKGKILEISSELVALAEQTNASVESLEGSGYAVKEMVTNTTSQSNHTQNKAEAGRNQMNELINNIQLIAKDTEIVNQLVEQLEKSSDEIGNVTNMVREIADQTNLLALNSAIEAARAGEYGKGFAVVSNEVKKLAEQTKKSVSEIQTIVSVSSHTTEQVISSLSNVKEAVEHGIETSQLTDKTFEEIVQSMIHNTSSIQKIDMKISELVEVIKEIGLATNGVAQSAEHLNASAKMA